MSSMLEWYRAGGPAMHLLLILALVGVGVFLERFYVIVVGSRISARMFIEKVIQLVRAEKVEEGIKLCARSKAALADIGLLILRGRSREETDLRTVAAAAAKAVIPRLTRRISYLGSLSTAAVLLGALGLAVKLSSALAAGTNGPADASIQASLWTNLALALNPMEFGLGVALLLRVADSYLESQAAMIIEQVEEFSMRLINALTDRPDVRLGHR